MRITKIFKLCFHETPFEIFQASDGWYWKWLAKCKKNATNTTPSNHALLNGSSMACQKIASNNRSLQEANKYLDNSKSHNICLTYDGKIDNMKRALNTEPPFDDYSSSNNVKKNEVVKQYPENVTNCNKDTNPLLDYYPVHHPKVPPAEVKFHFSTNLV